MCSWESTAAGESKSIARGAATGRTAGCERGDAGATVAGGSEGSTTSREENNAFSLSMVERLKLEVSEWCGYV